MESQPQNPEFRINPENFHPCSIHGLVTDIYLKYIVEAELSKLTYVED